MRSLLVASTLLAACVAGTPERLASHVDGPASSEATTVFLYEYELIEQPGREPLRNTLHMGSGILICPDVVLTVRHVADNGVFAVSNAPAPVQWVSAVLTDRATGTREKTRLGLAIPEDARIVGTPVTQPVRVRYKIPDGSELVADDGLTLLRIDPPYPGDLPYPPLSSIKWARGQQGQVHGYGDTNEDERDAGTRRTATFSRLGTLGLDTDPQRQFVLFGDEPRRIFGDSGGPLFGPLPGGRLAGLVQGIVDGRGQATVIPIQPHLRWLQRQRDALCMRSALSWDDSEGPQMVAEGEPTEQVDFADGPILQTAGDPGRELSLDHEVCVCDPDCNSACGTTDDAPSWEEPAGDM